MENPKEKVKKSFEISGILSKLPNPIFIEILLRLPIKSLCRCLFLSKAWYHTIKHPSFIEKYHDNKVINNNNTPPCFLIQDGRDFRLIDNESLDTFEAPIFSYPAKSPKRLFDIYSCNGLVFSTRRGFIYDKEPYIICNPITGDHIVVPKPPLHWINRIVFGFGFDPVSKVFKVIRILINLVDNLRNDSREETAAEVYTLGTDEWRSLGKVPFYFPRYSNNNYVSPIRDNNGSDILVNGALHWIGSFSNSMTAEEVILFKLDIEEFQKLPLPPGLGSAANSNRFLVELGECLCVVHVINAEYIRIWVMKNYGVESSWTKEYVIRITQMDRDYRLDPIQPVQLMKNGEMLLLCSDRRNSYLAYYNTKTKTFRYSDIGSLWRILPHLGSLISPRKTG